MAKGKKGKKGQEVKEGEAEQKDKLLEVDKEWYQIQIRSLEEKLERRNDKARALEVSNKEYQDRYAVLSIFEFFREIRGGASSLGQGVHFQIKGCTQAKFA